MIQVAARPLIGCLVFLIFTAFAAFLILISCDNFIQGSLYKDATSDVAFPFYDTALHTGTLDHPSPGREKQWPTAVRSSSNVSRLLSVWREGSVQVSFGLLGPARRPGQGYSRQMMDPLTPFNVATGVGTLGSALSQRTAKFRMARPAETKGCTQKPRS